MIWKNSNEYNSYEHIWCKTKIECNRRCFVINDSRSIGQ